MVPTNRTWLEKKIYPLELSEKLPTKELWEASYGEALTIKQPEEMTGDAAGHWVLLPLYTPGVGAGEAMNAVGAARWYPTN